MNVKDFLERCIDELSEIINIKLGDLNSLESQMSNLEDEILKYKFKRGVYRYYLKQKGELVDGTN